MGTGEMFKALRNYGWGGLTVGAGWGVGVDKNTCDEKRARDAGM